MKSPKDRYEQDPIYRKLVDGIEALIHQAQFTPSEVREAAVMACIHYEMRYGLRHYYTVPAHIADALRDIQTYRETPDPNAKQPATNNNQQL